MKINWRTLADGFLTSFLLATVFSLIWSAYIYGYTKGVYEVANGYSESLASPQENISSKEIVPKTVQITPVPTAKPLSTKPPVSWGGPDLWRVVNASRIENGVSPLNQQDELCTIASIRLNELLEIGKLDGHEGFSNLVERRSDLKWIFEKYVVAEFLAMGGQTAEETVGLWLNTLAHKKLLTGGEYVYGCTYAQNTFAVAIAAYQ